jgi:hypothetical protein
VHAQRDGQGPGKGVQAVIGAIGQEQQQLAQLVAPGGGLPEQSQGLGQGAKAAAGAEQLHGEHQPLAPFALAEAGGIGGYDGLQLGREPAQAIGIIEMQLATRNRPREAFLLGMGRIRKPAQLAPQGGEAHAADGVEVGRVHG